MTVLPFTPNYHTAKRLKAKREAEKKCLIAKIGINPADAPLFDEELAFMAYMASLGQG
jgi:hypothetical protein